MEPLNARWVGRVLLAAALAMVGLAVVILWRPRPIAPLPPAPVGPTSVQPFIAACQQGRDQVQEVHRCEHGWAVYQTDMSPQVFDEAGAVLCGSVRISDAGATSTGRAIECLRQFSDQVGRCSVLCSAPR